MPTGRRLASAVTIGSSIYVIGGFDERVPPWGFKYNIVEKYDTLENSWAPAPRLNRPRTCCSALRVGSSIFVLGGCECKIIERLDLNEPTAWEVFPTQMRAAFDQHATAVAVDRKIYVLGGGSGKRFVLDLDSQAWARLPRLPVDAQDDHEEFSKAFTLDGSIYLFGEIGVNKFEPDTGRWLTLPRCKGRYGQGLAWHDRLNSSPYLALLRPTQRDVNQPLPLQVHQNVIQPVTHFEEPAAVDPLEGAALVAEQWTQQVALNFGAGIPDLETPGLLLRLLLLTFTRRPLEFRAALLEGPELQSCRERMQGKLLPSQLGCGALVFVEPFQYNVAIEAATRQRVCLGDHDVITSERFEPNVMQAVSRLRSRLNVRLRSKQTILEPLPVQVVRTFLDVPDRLLRDTASVTHSTTDAHGGQNHRIFA